MDPRYRILNDAFTAGAFDSAFTASVHADPAKPHRAGLAAGVRPVVSGMLQFAEADPAGQYWQVVPAGRPEVRFPHYEDLGAGGFMLVLPSPKVQGYGLIDSEFATYGLVGFLGAAVLYDPAGSAGPWLGLTFRNRHATNDLDAEGFVALSISTSGAVDAMRYTPEPVEGAFASRLLGLVRSEEPQTTPGPMGRPLEVIAGPNVIRTLSAAVFSLSEALELPWADEGLAAHLPSLGDFFVAAAANL